MPIHAKAIVFSFTLVLTVAAHAQAAPVRVELKRTDSGAWQLLRDGKPYFIKGAGGNGSKEVLARIGGNSVRTWGVGDDTMKQLDAAHQLGLTVALGIWLGHTEQGFNYRDAKQVKDQYEKAREAILKYKDHPAVLLWGIGNEMEGYEAGNDPVIWKAVDDIAALAKQLDPNHPTMTVIAELGGQRVKSTHDLCPHVDIVGINSYAGVTSLGERYRKAGGSKPFIVTEFGPPGAWECAKNGWGIPIELSSTEKGDVYRTAYEKGVLGPKELCLGSYVFLWGHKQEATPTWFGMFLPDGTQLETVHTMASLWGDAPKNRCPRIAAPKVRAEEAAPGATLRASVDVSDPDGDKLAIKWVLTSEVTKRSVGGAHEDPGAEHADAIVAGKDDREVQVKMPREPGTYRLFAYARDGKGNGAVANTILRVTTESTESKLKTR